VTSSSIHFHFRNLISSPYLPRCLGLYHTEMAPLYQSLAHGQIRLLRLLPGSGSDPLACYLETVPLRVPCDIRYEALSYVWGDANEAHNIALTHPPPDNTDDNMHEFGIRANLRDALLSLRPKHASRLLWIDAICINQNDVSGRTTTLRLLKYIQNCCAAGRQAPRQRGTFLV